MYLLCLKESKNTDQDIKNTVIPFLNFRIIRYSLGISKEF